MRFSEIGTWPFTVGVPLFIALVLLLMRVFIMGRAQEKRQRANRQQTERLKSLVSAYRVLAGSFQPIQAEAETLDEVDRSAMEAALSDILLFGSADQVAMAAVCAEAIIDGRAPPLEPLVTDLRRDLRMQLGLAPIDAALKLPVPGPVRTARSNRKNGAAEGRESAGARGGGGGGGGLFIGGAASAGFHPTDEHRPN